VFLRQMFNNESGQSVLTDEEMQAYEQSWRNEDVLRGMLNYYRAMPQMSPRLSEEASHGPVTNLMEMKIPNIRVTTQTLILWGEQDLAFVPELLDGLGDYVPDVTLSRFKNGNHWIQHQYPDQVNQKIRDFISRNNE